MIRRIRKHLRLEAQAIALTIHPPALADDGAIQKISGIELQSRRDRPELHHAPGHRILEPGGKALAGAASARHDEIVVVAPADHELRIGAIADPLTDDRPRAKIEWRAGDRPPLAGRYERGIDRRVSVGQEGQPLAERVAPARFAPEVEVAVVGEVHDRWPIRAARD